MPNITFCFANIREWQIDLRYLVGERHPLTDVWLRRGWLFEFGPLSVFWEEVRG